MAITLADAQVNTTDNVEFVAIDETRRNSWLMDQFTFVDTVTPTGDLFTTNYTRLVTPSTAHFRAIGQASQASEAKRERVPVDLKVISQSFNVDRKIAKMGNAATNELAFQFSEATKAVRNLFTDAVINGDVAVDANGFDGLAKILAGSDTEVLDGADWSSATVTTEALAHNALDLLDELVAMVDGGADAILSNEKGIARIRSIARRAGYYTRSEDALGRVIERFGNAVLVDPGHNGADAIIPVAAGLTDVYAVKFGEDALCAYSAAGTPLFEVYQPDLSAPGAVKQGEVEMGPVGIALKKTRGAAVLRNIKVQ